MARPKSKRPAARPPAKPPARPRAKVKARPPARPRRAPKAPPRPADPALFRPLTEGERAAALRILLEDERMRAVAKVGRYRVISIDPLVVKAPDERADHRLARLVIYDYAGDVCVDSCVDLDAEVACGVNHLSAQPALSVDEELDAIAVARRDERVTQLAPGAEPVAVLHYWSRRETDLAYRRRSAAVVFGDATGPSVVAVVDLLDGAVADVVLAAQW